MPEYGTFCPVSVASDVLADRWTPLIVRELVLGNTRFNDIARGMPGISRSLLVQRLKHLERKGVVVTSPIPGGRGSIYQLTPAGRDLEPVLMALGRWAVHWLYNELDSTDVDAITLMWWLHRRVDPGCLPRDRVVVQFDHTAPRRVTTWLLFERGEPSVCQIDPGFAVDAVVTCATPALADVFSGSISWAQAVRSGSIVVAGSRWVLGALPTWFLWSPWADDVRAVGSASAPA